MPTWQTHKCKEESRKKQIRKSTGSCAAQCKSETINDQETEVLISKPNQTFVQIERNHSLKYLQQVQGSEHLLFHIHFSTSQSNDFLHVQNLYKFFYSINITLAKIVYPLGAIIKFSTSQSNDFLQFFLQHVWFLEYNADSVGRWRT